VRGLLAGAFLGLGVLLAQNLPDLYHNLSTGDPSFLLQKDWRPLLSGRDLSGWHALAGKPDEWLTTPAVTWRRIASPTRLTATRAPGDRIVNGPAGSSANLVTDEKFGDMELYLEFMLAKGSNSGVFLHGLYEVQIFDSYGFDGALTVGDCGGIYQTQDGKGGSPPLRNASRPPGEWQSLHIWFRAPAFDGAGRKIRNARVLRVMLNDMLVQGEVEIPEPTRSSINIPEAALNPLMLQGDHGPIAFRNIYARSKW
jgi:hypothetical protein